MGSSSRSTCNIPIWPKRLRACVYKELPSPHLKLLYSTLLQCQLQLNQLLLGVCLKKTYTPAKSNSWKTSSSASKATSRRPSSCSCTLHGSGAFAQSTPLLLTQVLPLTRCRWASRHRARVASTFAQSSGRKSGVGTLMHASVSDDPFSTPREEAHQ